MVEKEDEMIGKKQLIEKNAVILPEIEMGDNKLLGTGSVL